MSQTDEQVEGSSDGDDQTGDSGDPKWEPSEGEKKQSPERPQGQSEGDDDS